MLCILCIFADATRMGCAEAKWEFMEEIADDEEMQPAWDALRTGLFPEPT